MVILRYFGTATKSSSSCGKSNPYSLAAQKTKALHKSWRAFYSVPVRIFLRKTEKRCYDLLMETSEEQHIRLEEKIDAVYASVEKVRKYLLTTLIVTVITIVLPIILALFMVPMALSTFGNMYQI